MNETILLSLITFIVFFIQSVFGFGGSLLFIAFVSVLGLSIDTKSIILLVIYLSIIGSIFSLFSDYKYFSFSKFKIIFIWAIGGTILGTFLLKSFSAGVILQIFSFFLFILSINNLFFENTKIFTNKIFQKFLLILGGFMQGLFGVGPPFVVLAMKNSFVTK